MAGSWSTKIHGRTVAQGRAVRLRATTGQAGDYSQALPLLADLKPAKVLASSEEEN